MADREYKPGVDDADVLRLRSAVWGADHSHTDPAFFKWLFQETPSGAGTGVIMERDGVLVGFAGLANRMAQIGETQLRVAHGLEFMVDPSFRGMLSGRLSVKIAALHEALAERDGYDLNLNYPNDNSHRMLVSKRTSFQPVFEPSLYVCALGPITTDDASLSKRLALASVGLGAGLYARFLSVGRAKDVDVRPADASAFDEGYDDHWQRLTQDGKLRFLRDSRTLAWRYARNPLHDYTVFSLREGDRVDGYAVTTERKLLGARTMLLCDLGVAGNATAHEQALLSALKRHALAQRASMVAAQAIPGSAAAKSLVRGGFIRVPRRTNPKRFRMIATQNTPAAHDAMGGDNWGFTWGDMDVV